MPTETIRHERFIAESNKIELINRKPTLAEIQAHHHFINLSRPNVDDLKQFVSTYEPKATLRDTFGLDVRVGAHIPPKGNPNMPYMVGEILQTMNTLSPLKVHIAYEKLHPFTDCNGRSGRVLWAWQIKKLFGSNPDRFLQTFYYHTLSEAM